MLNIATGYSKNTLSCSKLNGEHAGEGFRSLRHILTPLWACKAKKCHFSRKFDLWPDLTRSNIDLGPKTICAIARSRRGASTGFFREALRPSGADCQGGGVVPTPPPDRPRYEKCPDRARVKPPPPGGGVGSDPPPLGFSGITSSFITVSTWNLAHLSEHQFGVVSCNENQNRPEIFCYRSNFVTSLPAILDR